MESKKFAGAAFAQVDACGIDVSNWVLDLVRPNTGQKPTGTPTSRAARQEKHRRTSQSWVTSSPPSPWPEADKSALHSEVRFRPYRWDALLSGPARLLWTMGGDGSVASAPGDGLPCHSHRSFWLRPTPICHCPRHAESPPLRRWHRPWRAARRASHEAPTRQPPRSIIGLISPSMGPNAATPLRKPSRGGWTLSPAH